MIFKFEANKMNDELKLQFRSSNREIKAIFCWYILTQFAFNSRVYRAPCIYAYIMSHGTIIYYAYINACTKTSTNVINESTINHCFHFFFG